MQFVIKADEFLSKWVAARIPEMRDTAGFGACVGIGVAYGEHLLGAVIYHDYQKTYGSLQLSFAADDTRWLIGPPGDRGQIIRFLMNYPFGQLGVQRVWSATPRRNKRARAFIDKFGFKREGCLRRAFGNDHAIVSGLLKEEWSASKWAVEPAAPATPVFYQLPTRMAS